MDSNIKELKTKIIVAFILSIASLQLLSTGSLLRSLLNVSFSFDGFINSTVTLLIYGVPISMSIVSLVFVKQGKDIKDRPYRLFKGFAYGFSIAALIIYGILFSVTFFVGLLSGNFFLI